MPKNKPEIVKIPPMNYVAVRGKGNPNVECGDYQQAISILYAVAYTLKMSYKTDYKIEGFFDVCNERGLTGSQGCIIPSTNVKDLVLKDEVVSAVKEGKFHIYAIDSIDDGIELLMGRKAGKKLANGGYSKDSVHYLVENKLKNYYKRASEN